MRNISFLFIIFAVVLPACGGAPGAGMQGKTVALVNGEAISEADLRKEAEGLPPYMRPILETPEGRTQFLESVITRDLLLREALRRGVDRRTEVSDRLSMARKSILLEALLRDVASAAPAVSDQALRKLYDSTPEKYRMGERVKVSHMLFRDRARAVEMLRRAKEGEPFEQLMKEVGGREGEVAADLGEKKPAGVQTFEEVKPQLIAEQRENAQREAFDSLIAGLRNASTIRIVARPGELEAATTPNLPERVRPAPTEPGEAAPAAPAQK
jgi:peptidyl-prolyl cis-trans isomerase C